MTEVLARQPEGAFGSSPLRRTSSSASLFCPPSHSHSQPDLTTPPHHGFGRSREPRQSVSEPSSAPSSPRLQLTDFSSQPSYFSTPSSSLSLDEQYLPDDELEFPNYEGLSEKIALLRDISLPTADEQMPQSSSRRTLSGYTEDGTTTPQPITPPASVDDETTSAGYSRNLARTPSYLRLQVIGDDTAVKRQPSRHVDYLSHDWKEEDIWSSWRHVVGKRRDLDNAERLENACWRSWVKRQRRLPTINPDKLNWMKDHDVTWLYGPLQTGTPPLGQSSPSRQHASLSRTSSFIMGKKPILKKRSISEVMLQRSISTSTLMRQAVDALQAQTESRNGRLGLASRSYSGFIPSSPIPSIAATIPETPTPFAVSSSSSSLRGETLDPKRHIRFDEKVEQCIAISGEYLGYESSAIDEQEDADDEEEEEDLYDSSHSSDDEILTMKIVLSKERKLSRSTPRGSFSEPNQNGKTIAMLPATTLKYRSDTPEPEPVKKDASLHEGTMWGQTTNLIKSPSQETIRPTSSSSNFLIDDCEEETSASVSGWFPFYGSTTARSSSSPKSSKKSSPSTSPSSSRPQTAVRSARSESASSYTARFSPYASPPPSSSAAASLAPSSSVTRDPYHDYYTSPSTYDEQSELSERGMRRTPSGMFMPYGEDEDEDLAVEAGLFGRVIDTVNTAKDIAHVIWNVGWRK